MTTTIADHVARYVAMKQKLGYRFKQNSRMLKSYAQFAGDRGELFIHCGTVLEWASATASADQRVRRLHTVHKFAGWVHAEDTRHEVPHRDALGHRSQRRPAPYLLSIQDIRKLLTAALSTRPAGTIVPLTWHYLFGLIAVTGLRLGEALSLTLDDITADGLIIRDAKFRKSRMVTLHPTTQDALNRYLETRRRQSTLDGHLFVLGNGRRPSESRTSEIFRRLAVQTGIRNAGAKRGPSLHSLRHSFAVRSIENLNASADPGRHMLALATYLGHVGASGTYWYLKSTPVLLRDIADAAEQTHKNGDSDD